MRKLVVALSVGCACLIALACGGAGGALLAIPPIPTGLTAIPGNGQVVLAWNPSNGATHYNVKRSTVSGGPYTVIDGPALPAYTDTTVTNGTTYFYVVSADSLAGESGNSAEVSSNPSAPAPVDVSIGANFSPVTIQARAGQTVRWTNNDFQVHTVTGDTANGPNSATAHPGGMAQSAVYTWTVPVTATSGQIFYYHCAFHGTSGGGAGLGVGMAGAVQVIP